MQSTKALMAKSVLGSLYLNPAQSLHEVDSTCLCSRL